MRCSDADLCESSERQASAVRPRPRDVRHRRSGQDRAPAKMPDAQAVAQALDFGLMTYFQLASLFKVLHNGFLVDSQRLDL